MNLWVELGIGLLTIAGSTYGSAKANAFLMGRLVQRVDDSERRIGNLENRWDRLVDSVFSRHKTARESQ